MFSVIAVNWSEAHLFVSALTIQVANHETLSRAFFTALIKK